MSLPSPLSLPGSLNPPSASPPHIHCYHAATHSQTMTCRWPQSTSLYEYFHYLLKYILLSADYIWSPFLSLASSQFMTVLTGKVPFQSPECHRTQTDFSQLGTFNFLLTVWGRTLTFPAWLCPCIWKGPIKIRLDEFGFKEHDWPALSPDRSPTEHVWECGFWPRPSNLKSAPDPTKALLADEHNSHRHTPKSWGKPSQKRSSY